jgi:dTDP-4-amino-4,6-dideoxygalactose transaminase
MSDLAILGGKPVITEPPARYRSMGEREAEAVAQVMASDCLSGFYGSPGDEYWGGPKIQEFEAAWRKRYGVAHAISVNSATSGLFAAMGAIGLSPGDEVIVPPWTMSATAMAPMVYGGIPIFADIEDKTFGLDPDAVRAAISKRTRAILAVNLFGHPARLEELRALANEHGLYLVEDNAQAPLGEASGRPAGTIGHIGVFSLNFHKHIHTGEGGVCVTDDEQLAKRLAMIRNHGENVTEWLEMDDLTNMIGFNYRMSELSAAIGLVQLGDIDTHVQPRERFANRLSDSVRNLKGLRPPAIREGCRHNYYCWCAKYDAGATGVDRDLFRDALIAEGVPCFTGYVAPLYRLPAFQKRIALGRDGFPFTLGAPDYTKLRCPVTERLHESEALLIEVCSFQTDDTLADRMAEAVRKVHAHAEELHEHGQNRAGVA